MILSFLLAALPTAEAQAKPFMWGVGPSVNTYLFPFGYPHSFPTTDDGNGNNNPDSNLSKSDFVMGFGGKGVMYMNWFWRAALRPTFTRGMDDSGYSAWSLSVEVDRTIQAANGINILAGAGLGTGGFTFDQGSSGGSLTARQLYARGQAGAMFRNPTRSYEVMIFAILGFSGQEEYTFNGNSYVNGGFNLLGEEASSESLGGGLYSPVIGVEGTVYFGDFTPNKKRRPQKKNKNKKFKKKK